jgi:hypothetical protein
MTAPKSNEQIRTRIKKVFEKVCRNNGCTMDGLRFYSPKQWKERGERYGQNSVMSTIFEEHQGMYYTMNAIGSFKLQNELVEELAKIGYWFELGNSWYLSIYEL